ncbi:hypothetical protein DFH08DRAFT_825748 [Mycena albidolilacea]|uniref:Uncharacterized protein n=1 Tax=Mycena albidolilacea TaxID=1033008 RepID=A0AAD7E8Y9_9AGAR|nr:hypothetical protein DFH08DRAFT_825748 [Mycena albidolilacea]
MRTTDGERSECPYTAPTALGTAGSRAPPVHKKGQGDAYMVTDYMITAERFDIPWPSPMKTPRPLALPRARDLRDCGCPTISWYVARPTHGPPASGDLERSQTLSSTVDVSTSCAYERRSLESVVLARGPAGPVKNDAIVELDNYRYRLGSPVAWFGDEDFPRQMRGRDLVEIHRKYLEIRPKEKFEGNGEALGIGEDIWVAVGVVAVIWVRVWALDEASGVFGACVQSVNVASHVQNHRNGCRARHVSVWRWRRYYVTAVQCEAPLEQIVEWMSRLPSSSQRDQLDFSNCSKVVMSKERRWRESGLPLVCHWS